MRFKLKKTRSGEPPGVAQSYSYLADNERIVKLRASIIRTARGGLPDPVFGTGLPAEFAESNAFFAQLMQNARAQAEASCTEDREFLIAHAAAARMGQGLQATQADRASIDVEHAARLDREVRVRLGRLGARVSQHAADIGQLEEAAHANLASLMVLWRRNHPHPDYLGHFDVPQFVTPLDAYAIGQAEVAQAFNASWTSAPVLGVTA